jgi:hypothetical protein
VKTIIRRAHRFTIPERLRHPYLRQSRVVSVQCTYCRQWVKPRYLRIPAYVCKWCEAQGLNQTWKPSAAHLARAYADVAREEAARRGALQGRVSRPDVTLVGR